MGTDLHMKSCGCQLLSPGPASQTPGGGYRLIGGNYRFPTNSSSGDYRMLA